MKKSWLSYAGYKLNNDINLVQQGPTPKFNSAH